MSYTRKQQGKKTKKSRNNRNRNYKKNNKKYGGVVPTVTISTATKAGLFGKKAITAVKVGSKLSKGNLSNLGVGIIDDALLHGSHYLFGKKGKKDKKQKGGDGDPIELLKTTLETADKIPGITFIPAYKIFSGLKDKLFDLLNVVKNEKILNVLNSKEMTAEEIKKQIKIIIGGDENIKNNIDKFKDVCSNLDKITSLPIIGKQLDKAIPHREELCLAFTEFNDAEIIENLDETANDIVKETKNIDTQETTVDVLENNGNIDTQETTDDVLENNAGENENIDETANDIVKETKNIDTQETTDVVLENNAGENVNPIKTPENVVTETENIENPSKTTDDVLENNNDIDNKNCIKTSGFVKTVTGATEFCYPRKKGGSRKSHKKTTRKSRKSKKSPRKSHKKK